METASDRVPGIPASRERAMETASSERALDTVNM
jgi:hypothetical protein